MEKTAQISLCGKYRYILTRTWDEAKPLVGWIMLNPSTADANEDDPTIRRCIGFARRWGYGGIVVVNLFPFRSTNPKVLMDYDAATLIGDKYMYLNAFDLVENYCDKVICAWGNLYAKQHELYLKDHKPFKRIALSKLCYLELTNVGNPKHPLYLNSMVDPIQFFPKNNITNLII